MQYKTTEESRGTPPAQKGFSSKVKQPIYSHFTSRSKALEHTHLQEGMGPGEEN